MEEVQVSEQGCEAGRRVRIKMEMEGKQAGWELPGG